MDKDIVIGSHNVNITSRKNINITGVKKIDNFGNRIINSKEFFGNLVSKHKVCKEYFDYVSKLIEKTNSVTKVEITKLLSFKSISRRYNEVMNSVSAIKEKMTDLESKSYEHAEGQKVRDLIEQVNSIINDNFNIVDKDNIILDGVVTDAPKKR